MIQKTESRGSKKRETWEALARLPQNPEAKDICQGMTVSLQILLDLYAVLGNSSEMQQMVGAQVQDIFELVMQGDVVGAQDLAVDIKARALLQQVFE